MRIINGEDLAVRHASASFGLHSVLTQSDAVAESFTVAKNKIVGTCFNDKIRRLEHATTQAETKVFADECFIFAVCAIQLNANDAAVRCQLLGAQADDFAE